MATNMDCVEKRISLDKQLEFYERMVLIRKFENKANEGYARGKVHGSLHTCVGEEACYVGSIAHLTKEDVITGTHREHGAAICKGLDVKKMMAELYGKVDGYCKGLSGSMHIASFEDGHIGANGIIGAAAGIALGAAFAFKYRGEKKVAVAFFGDGASNAGYSHECMNLAAAWELPIIFSCQNNGFAISTPFNTISKTRDIANRAAGYNMPSIIINGMDVLEVYDKMGPVVDFVRNGGGPYFVEYKTYRFNPHSRSDREVYRTKEEVDEWRKKCPILQMENRLKAAGVLDDAKIKEIDAKYNKVIEDAVAYAEASPEPGLDLLEKYVYCTEEK